MANRHEGFNDHDRRKMAIVRLAARIGMTLCQAEYRHLGEHEWTQLALGIMRPGESFEISADPDEVRHLRNAVARFRETMRFSIRKTDTGYQCTCIGDRI